MGARDQLSEIFATPFPARVSVRCAELTLARGPRTLFSNLSFDAAPGELVEIRGPNGGGKTSLLRAVAGFLRPLSGAVRIEGAEDPALALHTLGHRDGLKGQLDGRAHVRFWSALLGAREDRAAQALDAVGLTRIADLPARALSQGQARRLALARLAAAPRPVWLLDEPAAGLDAAGKKVLADLIAAHRAAGGLVLAALHEPLGAAPSNVIDLA